jgi:hypothetical protein
MKTQHCKHSPYRSPAFGGVAFGLALLLFTQPALALRASSAACPSCNVPDAVSDALPDAPLPAPQGLEIVILDGDGAINNIRQRTAREPIVQVQDENHKPVAGAVVLFTLRGSANGAGGSFNGATELRVTTDALGRAQGIGFTPNAITGKFSISVTASLGMLTAVAIIHQENIPAAIDTSSANQGGNGTTTASTAGNAPGAVRVTKIPILSSKFGKLLVFGGSAVAATAVIVTLVVLNSSNGANIAVGAGTVGHP